MTTPSIYNIWPLKSGRWAGQVGSCFTEQKTKEEALAQVKVLAANLGYQVPGIEDAKAVPDAKEPVEVDAKLIPVEEKPAPVAATDIGEPCEKFPDGGAMT